MTPLIMHLGVAIQRSKLEIGPIKLKLDVGTPKKPGRKTSKNKREIESLQNIANAKQATILDFTPKKK